MTQMQQRSTGFRLKALVIAVAFTLAMFAGVAAPVQQVDAARTRCYVLDQAEWYLIFGELTDVGGTVCYRR